MSDRKSVHFFHEVLYKNEALRATSINGTIWFLATDIRNLANLPQRELNRLYGLMTSHWVRTIKPEGCGPGSSRKALSTAGAAIVLRRAGRSDVNEFEGWATTIEIPSKPRSENEADEVEQLRRIAKGLSSVRSDVNRMFACVANLIERASPSRLRADDLSKSPPNCDSPI